MSLKPFRFGLSFAGAPTRRQLTELVTKAEDNGFSVICTADHLTDRHATLPSLAVAASISNLRVSPMVIANDYRHPVTLAREAATIDILSDGRFELGIGTGWIKPQYDSIGLSYDSPKTRVDRLTEAIDVIKSCWSGQPVSYSGEHYTVNAATCPEPVQKPRPPMLIVGTGRRMLGLAGMQAEIVGISPLANKASGFEHFAPAMATSGDRIEDQLHWIRTAAGDRFDELELSVFAHHLESTDEPEKRAAGLAEEWGATPEQILASPHIFLGPTERIRDLLLERRERFGISYVVFSSLNLDEVIPIVSELAGV